MNNKLLTIRVTNKQKDIIKQQANIKNLNITEYLKYLVRKDMCRCIGGSKN